MVGVVWRSMVSGMTGAGSVDLQISKALGKGILIGFSAKHGLQLEYSYQVHH